jgi:MFS superfamily sulfate permease-like transporter
VSSTVASLVVFVIVVGLVIGVGIAVGMIAAGAIDRITAPPRRAGPGTTEPPVEPDVDATRIEEHDE